MRIYILETWLYHNREISQHSPGTDSHWANNGCRGFNSFVRLSSRFSFNFFHYFRPLNNFYVRFIILKLKLITLLRTVECLPLVTRAIILPGTQYLHWNCLRHPMGKCFGAIFNNFSERKLKYSRFNFLEVMKWRSSGCRIGGGWVINPWFMGVIRWFQRISVIGREGELRVELELKRKLVDCFWRLLEMKLNETT
jgi:hypothetical protein